MQTMITTAMLISVVDIGSILIVSMVMTVIIAVTMIDDYWHFWYFSFALPLSRRFLIQGLRSVSV